MGRASEWLDLLRKEEIPSAVVHSAWDAKMLPSVDDPDRPALMGWGCATPYSPAVGP
ncbi:hypothetical protein ALMP_81920 [Streptomyces sp. A012304]|nr:hypothetical protein ALMP_81920 [Streptomyces sp. A012304]